MCTGSGCIAISLAKNRPDTSGIGADISEDALKMAEEAGEARAVNLVLLGALCRDMGSDKEAWEKAIAACVESGDFSQYVATALEQASGDIYEGLIEE